MSSNVFLLAKFLTKCFIWNGFPPNNYCRQVNVIVLFPNFLLINQYCQAGMQHMNSLGANVFVKELVFINS